MEKVISVSTFYHATKNSIVFNFMETTSLINLLKEKAGSKEADENGQAVWLCVLFPQNTNLKIVGIKIQKQNLTASVRTDFFKGVSN